MSEEEKSKFVLWLKKRKRIIIGVSTILLLIFMTILVDFIQFIQNLVNIGFLGLVIFVIIYTIAFLLRAYKLKLIFNGLEIKTKPTT